MQSLMRLAMAALLFSLALRVESKDQCPSRCSPHITLPCSFPTRDPCMVHTCQQLCQDDDARAMIGCFCRGSVEGHGMRMCFCGPSRHKNATTVMF